jgi:CRP-like cAMP-binding protein
MNPALELSEEALEKKVASLHFFKEIGRRDPQQLRALIRQSHLYSVASGETFLKAGEQGSWMYFLMRGELLVCDPLDHRNVIGVLIPGDVFGEIAVITGQKRTLDIVVPSRIREAIVFATDFACLNSGVSEKNLLTLQTQLIIYRQIVHILRWRIELYRTRFPDNPLVRVPFNLIHRATSGDTEEELRAQRDYALFLADRLQQLNTTLGPINSNPGDAVS